MIMMIVINITKRIKGLKMREIVRIEIEKSRFDRFLSIALYQKISKAIYENPFFFMKALELALTQALTPEVLDMLGRMRNNIDFGIIHFSGFPTEQLLIRGEEVSIRNQYKSRVSESLILAIAAILNCYLYSKKTEQNGSIFHNISPVKGKEHVVSSVGRDPFYYHTEIAYSSEVPKFLMLFCLEADPEAKTSYYFIDDIMRDIPDDIKSIMRKPIFKLSGVKGYDADSVICSLLTFNEQTGEETFRFYQKIERIEPAPRMESEASEVTKCLEFLEAHAQRVFPESGKEPAVGLKQGEALLFNNGRGFPDQHVGVMHGRVGRIQNPQRWLHRGYFFEITPEIHEQIKANYLLFLHEVISKKKYPLSLAVACLKTAIENSEDYKMCAQEHPEYTKSRLLFHGVKPRNDTMNGRNSWLNRVATEAAEVSTMKESILLTK